MEIPTAPLRSATGRSGVHRMKPKPPSWAAVRAEAEAAAARLGVSISGEGKTSEQKMFDAFVSAAKKVGGAVSKHDIDYVSCGVRHSWVNKKIALMVENGLLIRVSRGRYIPVLP